MLYKCSNHFGALAGWRCNACRATLCADCTSVRVSGSSRFESCSRCGAFASPILVHRGELHPFSAGQLAGALLWPFSRLGLLSVSITAVLATALGLAGAKGSAIATGVTIAYLFQALRHTAHGHDDFPTAGDFQGYFEDVVAPSWRVGLALAWIWVPALAWMLWHRAPAPDRAAEQRRAVAQALKPGGSGLNVHGMRVVRGPTGFEVVEANAPPLPVTPEQRAQQKEDEASAADPPPAEAQLPEAPPPSRSPLVPILLALLGVVIVPMSLIASALKTPLAVAANPIVLVGYAVKLGRDYLLLVAFCLCAVALALGARVAGHALLGGGLVARLPVNLAVLLVAFAAFRGIGLLVRVRGSDLGYGEEESYLVPVLGDQQPRWVAPAPPLDSAPAAPLDSAPAGPLDSAPAAPPDSAPPDAVPPAPSPAETFALLLAQDDTAGLLALLAKSGKEIRSGAMPAQGWMDLAQKAWQQRNARAAAVALRRCLDAEPQGALAPKAWLQAARVYAEALGDQATSDKLLRELVQRFPESEPGKIAAQRLARAAAT